MAERENLTGRPPLTDAQRAISRTQRIMQNLGKGWSDSMRRAEDSVYGPPPKGFEAGETHWSDRKRQRGE